ncbi:MAG: amidohydrolase family protein [Planctomycetota bacterium]
MFNIRVLLLAFCVSVSFSHQKVSAQDFSDIPVVDTHIHLYDTERDAGLPWPPETDKVLYRPVLPKDFNKVADANGVNATVIVEASVWLSDNQWVLDLVKKQPERYIGLVGSLEIGKPGFEENLKKLSADPRFVGIRMRERDSGEHEPEDFFTDAVWSDLKLLADMDQTLDVLMFHFSLEEVAMVARRLPHLKILINHVAGANIEGKPADAKWIQGVKLAARQPNVYCKISGLFQQSHRQPSPTGVEFYKSTLDVLTKEFGEDRIVYGSNWPVTMRGGSYGDFKSVVMKYYSPMGRDVLEKLLYKNALKFYGLENVAIGK